MSLEESAAKVFNVAELLEMILDYVLHKDNGQKVSTVDARSCRLVNKAWLSATSGCLLKSNKPLFHLNLNKDNWINGTTLGAENGKLLDKFVNTVMGPTRLYDQIPPFKIKAHLHFFREENYESLLNCFTKCGNSLVDLDIELHTGGGTMMFAFPNLSLPKLQCCTVEIFRETTTEQLAVDERIVGETNYFYWMEKILSGCRELKKLKVKTTWAVHLFGFERLVLPPTLSTLLLDIYDLENKNLQHLMRNHLPNLKRLELSGIVDSLESALIYNVLKKFRNQLTQFKFYQSFYNGPPKKVTYFQLPVMKELIEFDSNSTGFELEMSASELQHKLPNLRKLCLTNQTVEMFEKWTKNSNFASVEELVTSLADENFEDGDRKYPVSFASEMVLSVSTAFRNLRTLEITVCRTTLCGLRCVFQNLKRLKVLRVNAKQTLLWIKNSDLWDALFIGIPVELATVLRTTGTWSQVPYFNNGIIPSIRDLTELEQLDLATFGPFAFLKISTDLAPPLISDAVFELAFLKMLRLTKLVFAGRFMVSPEAKQEWEDKGRQIIYVKYSYKHELIDV